MVDVLIRWWESFCKVYIDQLIMTYALNIWQFYCQLYLSKAEKKNYAEKMINELFWILFLCFDIKSSKSSVFCVV